MQNAEHSSVKAVYDAMTGFSTDGCDPDWCYSVLQNARQGDIHRVEDLLRSGLTEAEAASELGILS